MAAFIDFNKAFERVNMEKLWGCLRGYGVKGSMLEVLYLENSMKIGDKWSDCFPVSTGLRQCCVLSLLLFSLYINGLIAELKLK